MAADQVTLTIRKYRAQIKILGDKIVSESRQQTLNEYKEYKSLYGVSDPTEVRGKFIEEMGRKIYNQNRSAELKAVREKSLTIEKLLIVNIN